MRWKYVILSSLIGCLVGPLPGLAANLTMALEVSSADAAQESRADANAATRPDQQKAAEGSHPMLDLETGLAAADSIFSNQENYQVAFSPVPEIGLYAGYRFPQKDVFKRDITADVEFDGPYVGAVIRY